jgi:UPF0716 protein FxsA
MFLRLLLLLTILPALELYLLIQLGQWMGTIETVALILVTGAVGAALAKREGLGVLRQLQEEARMGLPPADRLVEGLLVLIGGVLLITPGVITDLTGFLLIAPPTRRWLAPRIKQWVGARINILPGVKFGGPTAGRGASQQTVFSNQSGQDKQRPASPFDHPVS